MSTVGQRERATQDRIVSLLRDDLGYDYLGNWQHRAGNANVETGLLADWLRQRGTPEPLVTAALRELGQAAAVGAGTSLYDANRAVYSLLRYGVQVKAEAGEHKQNVPLVDWDDPHANHVAVAQEVAVSGPSGKRPDVVVYVNGIAWAVLELKRSTVSVAEGVRQNLDNQKPEFIRSFFSTVQLVTAGNDTEGFRYGAIETPEKHYLSWREEAPGHRPGDPAEAKYLPAAPCTTARGEARHALDCAVLRLFEPSRLLEVVRDFVVFDAGVKKLPRHNQYFGVKAAQRAVRDREGGIVWHTQGSGKSLTMVWLAKWIRENVQDGRVLVVTDRTELDDQIEKVFGGVGEAVYRTDSGADLVAVLGRSQPWLVCSLVHKFGAGNDGDASADAFVREVQASLPDGFRARGQVFVFVDEAHRTQSGKLNRAMRAVLPDATFIGFTGTPLLKKDKETTVETFGPFIHTYKFDQAVRDGVVLDLRYEARDIDQDVSSQAKVDQWFDAKTRGLSDLARAELKKKWGTMRKVLSSRSRLETIVADVLFDMETRDRLMSGRGNAMLVASSIYQACKYYELFAQTHLAGKCAIVTSYAPAPSDIKGEETGEGLTERLHQYGIYRQMLARHFDQDPATAATRVEEFERDVKTRFVKEPGQMKLLIVVDKLLTGFDAPPASYLYIDKSMRDHGLFQAICRVNRLDGDDKEYGYVVDYKDLFHSLEGAIGDYTGSALDGYDREDVAGLLESRVAQGRERLDDALDAVRALCEPVAPPQDTLAFQHYFCAADTADRDALAANEPRRVSLYKHVAALVRAYAGLANDMAEAGYTAAEAQAIRSEVSHYESVRQEVKLTAGDYIDTKVFEPAMRHLLDAYIRAEDSTVVSMFDDMGLVDLVVNRGVEAAREALPRGIASSDEAMAEAIENNVRRVLIDERDVNPKYYDRMSELLDALIEQRRTGAADYAAHLESLADLAHRVRQPDSTVTYPSEIDSEARRSLYDNLDGDSALAARIDAAVCSTRKDGWRGNVFKEREIKRAIHEALVGYDVTVDEVFELVAAQRDY